MPRPTCVTAKPSRAPRASSPCGSTWLCLSSSRTGCKPAAQSSKPEARNLKPESCTPKPETRNPNAESRNPRNPKPPKPHFGRSEEALGVYNKALSAFESSHQLLNNFGNLYRQMGRLKDAVAAYQACLHIKGDYALAHNNLALVHILRQEWDAAAQALTKALQLDPGLDCAKSNVVKLNELRRRSSLVGGGGEGGGGGATAATTEATGIGREIKEIAGRAFPSEVEAMSLDPAPAGVAIPVAAEVVATAGAGVVNSAANADSDAGIRARALD
jgi:hypothetical protein